MDRNIKKLHINKQTFDVEAYTPVYQYKAPVNGKIDKYYYSTDELPVFSGWTRDVAPVFYAYTEQVYGSVPIYESCNQSTPSSSAYFMLSLDKQDGSIGWYNIGVAFYACPRDAGQTININSFYNDSQGVWSFCYVPKIETPLGYVYSSAEADAGFAVPLTSSSSSVAGAIPIYLYSRPLDNSGHETYYYSTNQNGLSGWSYNGIVFYAYKTQVAGTIPINGSRKTLADGSSIYRLDSVQWNQDGWMYEGVAFYAFPDYEDMAGTTLVSPSYLSIASNPGTYSTYYFANGTPKNYLSNGKVFSAFRSLNIG